LKLSIGQSIGSGRLSLLGYNSGRNQITESVGCEQYSSIQFASEKLLLHDCDARSGASGGPLLLEDKNHQATQLIAIHGGTLLVNNTAVTGLQLNSQTNSANRDGAVADPERWINQARRVDQSVLMRLQQFAAYLAKGSLGQR
jgi:V8-like Glu-specific endopeptidase